MSCVALVVYNGANDIAGQYKDRLSTEVLLNVDYKRSEMRLERTNRSESQPSPTS